MAKKEPGFEEALRRLEEIVQAIEQGKVGLEESIGLFEEGMGLVKRCRGVLGEAELRIQRLQAVGEDGVGTVPGGGVADVSGGSGA